MVFQSSEFPLSHTPLSRKRSIESINELPYPTWQAENPASLASAATTALISAGPICRLTSYPIEKAGFDSEGLPFFMAPPPRHERSEPRRNSAPHRLNAKNPLSLVPSCHEKSFLDNFIDEHLFSF